MFRNETKIRPSAVTVGVETKASSSEPEITCGADQVFPALCVTEA